MDLDLLRNALDFLSEGFNRFHQLREKESNRKYAVLNVASGVLLMLKVPLANEHWTLLFADVNDASAATFTSGEFYGINFKESIRRLNDVCGIDVSALSRTLKALTKKR